MRTIGVIPAACACATRSTTVSRLYAECSVQIITKSMPAAASVCTTPRPRVSHISVPSAAPPFFNIARSRLTRIALFPQLRNDFGVEVCRSLFNLAVFDPHHPAIGLAVVRPVLPRRTPIPLQHHFVAVDDNVAQRRLDRSADLLAERLHRPFDKCLLAL